MPNALATESSPYLRQHQDNPVDWRPWGEAAFAEAKRRDVPVLVSIGYSTCHWCHVMAHECFENAATALVMNDKLVCIKVDREEHPEVDAIYMDAVQALSGHGGWPLNAFVDHQGRPFYACTYLPDAQWQRLIGHLDDLWRSDRARIDKAAREITAHLADTAAVHSSLGDNVWQLLERALAATYDANNPGYGWNPEKAPKFPSSQLLPLLFASGRVDWIKQAESVLEAMQDAGIHDRVGGGFHRYSVDKHWRMPHFEKMLYDNAQLMVAYARAGEQLARPDFLRTAVNTGDYLLRDLRVDVDGAFAGYASAEDADDPGGEGSFYAWSPTQLREALGDPVGERLAREWDIIAGHRERGHSGHLEPVLSHIPHPRGTTLATHAPGGDVQALRTSWEPHLPILRALRAKRPRPGRDDKVLTDQNALALEGFAALGRYSGEQRFIDACRELAAVLLRRHTPAGLLRLPNRPAYITDYGAMVSGLTAAFDLLGDPALVHAAERIADEAVERLRAEDGGFYTTPAGRTDLVRRGREDTDNAWPSGQNSLAVGLVRLWNITGTGRWKALAEEVFS
nr:thioredoxin domain-containing protein [Planctomycetota bacterium]